MTAASKTRNLRRNARKKAARLKGRPTPRKVRLGERAAKIVRRGNREKTAVADAVRLSSGAVKAESRERGRRYNGGARRSRHFLRVAK